jgi:hypothetical protein
VEAGCCKPVKGVRMPARPRPRAPPPPPPHTHTHAHTHTLPQLIHLTLQSYPYSAHIVDPAVSSIVYHEGIVALDAVNVTLVGACAQHRKQQCSVRGQGVHTSEPKLQRKATVIATATALQSLTPLELDLKVLKAAARHSWGEAMQHRLQWQRNNRRGWL